MKWKSTNNDGMMMMIMIILICHRIILHAIEYSIATKALENFMKNKRSLISLFIRLFIVQFSFYIETCESEMSGMDGRDLDENVFTYSISPERA